MTNQSLRALTLVIGAWSLVLEFDAF